MTRIYLGGTAATAVVMLYAMFSFSAIAAVDASPADAAETKAELAEEIDEAKANATANLTGHAAVFKPAYANFMDTAKNTVVYGIEFGRESPGIARLNGYAAPFVMVASLLGLSYREVRRLGP